MGSDTVGGWRVAPATEGALMKVKDRRSRTVDVSGLTMAEIAKIDTKGDLVAEKDPRMAKLKTHFKAGADSGDVVGW